MPRPPRRSAAPAARPAAAPPARRPARKRDSGVELARRLGLASVPSWAPYVHRGHGECAFAQVRLVGRVVGALYDDALKPVGLRASQLALMWAIVAMEPVDMTTLGEVTLTDQTTLSRTVDTLRRSGLVGIRAGDDRRVKLLRLTAAGKARFAAAMPLWEKAQREAARLMPLDVVRDLGRRVRKAMHQAA